VQKPPLYRKVNTTARGVHHRFGGEFRHERNEKGSSTSEAVRLPMRRNVRRGLDYTPLFRFLLSKVGAAWADVQREAVPRLDRPEVLYWLVARNPQEEKAYVRLGDASYYSGLRVDEYGKLQLVDSEVGPSSLVPWCPCCTHTFNGVRFTLPYNPDTAPRSNGVRVA